MRLWKAALGLIATVSLCLGTALPVSADTFPGSNFHYADSRDHSFCFGSGVTATPRSVAVSAMDYLDVRTIMYDVYLGEPCPASTDVVFVETTNIGGQGAAGAAICVAYVYTNVCGQWWVEYDPTTIYYRAGVCGLNYFDNLSKTIRHETGHSTGLDHGSQVPLCSLPPGTDAMVSGVIPSQLQYVAYNDHHSGHIDATY